MSHQPELIPTTPGDILRYHREAKGLSLRQASDRSRMKSSLIQAIENNETSGIPSVYLHGHIRNYARFLGVAEREIEPHMRNVRGAVPEVRSVFSGNARRAASGRWVKVSSYLAASALIGTLAWQFTHEAVRISQGDRRAAAAGAMLSEPQTQNQPGRHLSASIAPVPAPGLSQEAPPLPYGDTVPPGGTHQLNISASADTWVEIYGKDGRQIEMDLVRAGSSRDYRGSGPFRVMIGRASSVVLRLDGNTVDLGPHTRGNVARLTLAASAAADARSGDG